MQRNLYDPSTCSWYRLNLSVTDAVLPGVIESLDFDTGAQLWSFQPQDILTASWLTSLPYTVQQVLVFARTTDFLDSVAHIDSSDIASSKTDTSALDWFYLPAAINWCIGEDHRPMQWWRRGQAPARLLKLETQAQGGYVAWPLSELTPLDQLDHCVIGGCPTLVRIDQPHSLGAGPGTRISVSVRLTPWSTSWPEIVHGFARLIRWHE